MSEALFAQATDGTHEARSAGTRPAQRVHPAVVAAMREVGVNLDGKLPAMLTTELAQWADLVVTMGCGDACPVISGKRYVDWDLPDPKDMPIESVREVRDDIAGRVRDLVRSIDSESISENA